MGTSGSSNRLGGGLSTDRTSCLLDIVAELTATWAALGDANFNGAPRNEK